MEASEGDRCRFRVVHATRMSNAVDILGNDAIDVILPDSGLPDSSGPAALAAIQATAGKVDRHTLGDYGASPRVLDVPIAAVSRSVEDSSSVKARTLAVQGDFWPWR